MIDKTKAIELRKQGLTYEKIAEHFGVTRQRVHQLIGISGEYDTVEKRVAKYNKEMKEFYQKEGLEYKDISIEDYLRVRPLTNAQKRKVFERDNFTCQYCLRKFPFVKIEVDHKIPTCRGGNHDIENLITACRKCNNRKTYKTYNEFINNEKVKISNILGTPIEKANSAVI